MITVRSWDDLLKSGTDIVLNKIQAGDIELGKGLAFQIRVTGAAWNSYIDYRGASYIIELQKAVNRLYRQVTGSEIQTHILQKEITVKVRVVEGSSIFEIRLNDVLKGMLEKMSGKQIVLTAIVAMLVVFGYFTTTKVLEYQRDVAQMQLSSAIAGNLASSLDKAIEIIGDQDLEKPTRSLISKLDRDDTITMPDKQELSADQARQRYPRKPPAKPTSDIFDEVYTIKSIDFDKIPPVFTIEKDGVTFRASAELPEKDIDELSKSLNATLKAGINFVAPLHVFIVYTKQGPKSASITGLGDKRSGSKPFSVFVESPSGV